MTWAALTIGPEVAQARVGALPVVEGRRVIGILTERDVVRVLAATLPDVRGADPDDYLR